MGHNPLVICSSIVIILCKISGYAAEPKLGCEFVRGYQFKDTAVNTPIFGQEMSPYPIDEKEIENFLIELNKFSNEYLAINKYNNIDNFFPFVDYIKSDPNKPFSKMIEDYKPPYYAADTIGQATGVIEYLSKKLPSPYKATKQHFFIAAARMGITAKTLEDMKTADSDKKKPYPNHVVAALKILVDNTIGYIIIDPKYHAGKVVLVMPDVSSPQSKVSANIHNVEKKFEFSISKDDPSYIISKEVPLISIEVPEISKEVPQVNKEEPKSSKEVPQSSDDTIDIYYMKEAYCTFLDLTAKDEMLTFLRCMVRRTTLGYTEASVKIELLPTSEAGTTKLMGTFYYLGARPLDIPIDSFIETDELNKAMTEDEGKHFANTYNRLKLFDGIKAFKKKLQELNKIYKNNNNILKQMYEMRANSKYLEDTKGPVRGEIQTPIGGAIPAPIGAEIQEPKGDEIQAVQEPLGGQRQAPRGGEKQTPRGGQIQAPRGGQIESLTNAPLVKKERKWYHRILSCFFGGND